MSKLKEEHHNTHQLGELRALPANVEETRTVQFVISNSTRDRHRTVLDPTKWQLDNFNRNGIVGYQHNVYGDGMCSGPNPDDVIGRGRAFLEGDQLIGEVTFEPADINPQAEKIFRKVLFGSLRATSVGFAELGKGKYGTGKEARGGTEETYYFAGQELLEFSIVNIPSNPDATKRALRDQASHALMFIKRALGDGTSFADIESMKVADVLRLLDKASGRATEPEEEPETEATELPEGDNLDTLRDQLALKARF
ncbi:MAG: hypothetical protein ACRYG7_14170 [Janthinobacterium lividum]